ncbi:NosD domain-containing protein [Anaerostipes sp.]|uniref:NosD domain-containing protein n=1 Tax=Anaerostipes sp. TaxID=1872530 RepID=UPI0025C4416D|nr:right-handed parallel beta-helix repeat-containing protein [Anaerostipes sp.]MBS7007126.1 right-handed parallel beta-helix repeat-containing protein [Anaerostipes sp.]
MKIRINIKGVIIAVIVLTTLILFSESRKIEADNNKQVLKQTNYVNTFRELENLLKKEHNTLNIVLESDITCGNKTLYIEGNTNLDLNGHVLYKTGGKPLFYLGDKRKQEKIKLIEDLKIEPAKFPEDFIVKVENTESIKKGQRIYISDGSAGEKNIVSKVINKTSFLVKERPNRIYKKSTAKVEILSDKTGDITIKNGKIENNKIKFDMTQSKGKESIIVSNYSSDIEINNIKIVNKNYNQNSIGILKSENVVLSNCRIEGGRNAVVVDSGSSMCKILGNTFYDCSGGVFLSGNNNLISDNVITASGATLNSGDGITILESASFNIIKSNQILGGNCYGIWGLKGKRTGNSITDNVIQANVTYGIYLEGGDGYLINNNKTERNSGGICIDQVTNSNISNNYVTNNLISGISIGEKVKKCIIKNNTLSGNNYVDPDVAGYGGDVVVWGNPEDIIVEDNVAEQKMRKIE